MKEQNTVLDPELVAEMLSLMPPEQLAASLNGVEQLAKYATVVLRRRKRARDR